MYAFRLLPQFWKQIDIKGNWRRRADSVMRWGGDMDRLGQVMDKVLFCDE